MTASPYSRSAVCTTAETVVPSSAGVGMSDPTPDEVDALDLTSKRRAGPVEAAEYERMRAEFDADDEPDTKRRRYPSPPGDPS